ncbi:uncharacterized protein MYCFIDRAFT_82709 [Pseudocercospora fijiensis CIRAD86]|uniref:Uncharacterized protein n=1 Tax=Pseudocercospora fijiensis (strain CIRAD86) TaxID=383855 RepID=M3B896_PSEFD|nr:uncharacterized protein MYCFIDRAFT_82709 [Pseudocercospora fijiensis CIRAD86]EME85547.1 hypothetical protein MYCFIDRAFT_82709 [Pseudocercospora fijiensis CIRAD86]
MSAIRIFNNIPHIVRGGMHDEKASKSSIHFWRCGVRFWIDVSGQDILGTSFHEKWKPLIREEDYKKVSLKESTENKWHPLCDLIISTSMELLRELAPAEKEYWSSLDDYLHCPGYKLRIKAVSGKDAVEVEVAEGPKLTGAYNMAPAPFEDYHAGSNDLPTFCSTDLVVLDKEQDWRQPPQKVQAPDGKIYFFKACEQSAMHMPDQKVVNHSLDAIAAHLSIYELMLAQDFEPLQGVLTFQGLVTCDCVDVGKHEVEMGKAGIAGILLPWTAKGRTLFEICRDADDTGKARILAVKDDWKMQVEMAVGGLHERGVFLGGRKDWAYLNYHTVMIDADDRAWLTAGLLSVAEDAKQAAREGCEQDVRAVNQLFEEWLPAQVS